MAQCKRCGTVFDYEKREGVCPKCCFYNRPPGTWQDDEWTKNYNIEDNSYDLPKKILTDGRDFEKRITGRSKIKNNKNSRERFSVNEQKKEFGEKKNRAGRTRISEDRTGNGRVRKVSRNRKGGDEQARLEQKSPVLKIVMLVIFCVIAIYILIGFYENRTLRTLLPEKKTEEKDFQVETKTMEEAKNGIDAGDVTYFVDHTKVLFQEGSLASMPAGEKCIGIWIEGDESVIDYYGTGWNNPYVFDGTYFREMVDTDNLDDAVKFEDIETCPPYLSVDKNGYAVFFVDAKATSVILSLPCQSVEAGNNDKINCSGVIEIEIPIQ